VNDNAFFKPTPLYKEFMILDMIEKEGKITQRNMSDHLSVSVSMINGYLDEYEKEGYIKRKYINSKTVSYGITKRGIERKKVLNIQYLKASSLIYNGAKNNITVFLNQIIKKGFKKILLFGAGEVAEILLQTINGENTLSLNVVGVIDDDEEKQNHYLINTKIISPLNIGDIEHDGILISSYTNKKIILNKLLSRNYNPKRILNFFEI